MKGLSRMWLKSQVVLRGLGAGNGLWLLGNLHIRFCEGANSNLGAIIPTRGALWALLDKSHETNMYGVTRI